MENIQKLNYSLFGLVFFCKTRNIHGCPLSCFKNTILDINKKKSASWSVELDFTANGYARLEISDSSRECVKDKIIDMLTNIDLYSEHRGEHIHGIMPTAYGYSTDEINNGEIDVQNYTIMKGDSKIHKNIYIVDDLKLAKYYQSQQINTVGIE